MTSETDGAGNNMHRVKLVAAPFTPFDSTGAVNFGLIEAQLEQLTSDGVAGAFVGGTTAEMASLTTEERLDVAAAWCRLAPAGFAVTVNVSHTSLEAAQALARGAERSGAAGIAAVSPYYHQPADLEALVSWCAQVADTVELPFLYYHIPSVTHCAISPADLVKRAQETISTFSGVKYTDDCGPELDRCVDAANPDVLIMSGRDEALLSFLPYGITTAVGTTYNFAAPLYQALATTFFRGDHASARRWQTCARAMIDVCVRWGGLAAFKALALGPAAHCRPPLRTLDDKARQGLTADLLNIGFFDSLEEARRTNDRARAA